ncbi:hypothetical protein HWV62_11528 [Athelia sp. TMB]|nr:hypothetical protein HWV62_11528 [Athelia sp. TMB]
MVLAKWATGSPARAAMVPLARDGGQMAEITGASTLWTMVRVKRGYGHTGILRRKHLTSPTGPGDAAWYGRGETTTADGDHGVGRSEYFDNATFGGECWGGGGEGIIMPRTMLRTATDTGAHWSPPPAGSTVRRAHLPRVLQAVSDVHAGRLGTYRRPRRARAAPDDHEPRRALAAAARLARGDGVAEPGLVRAAGGAGVAEGAADGLVGEVGRLGEEGRRDGDGVGGVLEDGLGAAEAGAWLCLGLGRHARALGGYRGEGMQGDVGGEEEAAKIASSGGG